MQSRPSNTILVLHLFLEFKVMRVTTKGQVTIPRNIREVLGISPESEIDFVEEDRRFKKLRGISTAQMSTDEIMNLTREV